MSNYKYSSDPVKVMWVNPLGYTDFDDPIAELLAEIKDPRTHLEVVSLAQPVHTPHLEYRVYEAMVIADLVRVVRQASLEGFDALAIGCFYDLGLEDARQISGDMVVVAPCQAAVQILTNLCNRFSVLVGQHFWIEQMTDRVRYYGQGDRLASMRPLGLGVRDFQADKAKTEQRLLDAAKLAVNEDHAEGLILGCTGEFGFFQELQNAVGVPVIDAVFSSFKMAEYLGGLKKQLGWQTSRKGSMVQPPEEELRAYKIFDAPAPIGNRIVIR